VLASVGCVSRRRRVRARRRESLASSPQGPPPSARGRLDIVVSRASLDRSRPLGRGEQGAPGQSDKLPPTTTGGPPQPEVLQMRKETWFRGPLLCGLLVVLAASGAAVLIAQDDDHALRLWLIDRIEQAYADGDTETLRHMAEAEYQHQIAAWLHEQSDGLAQSAQSSKSKKPGSCPPGTTYVENDGLCHQNPSTGPTGPPVPPFELPEVPPHNQPPPQPPSPPVVVHTPPRWGTEGPPIPDLCASAGQTVARCSMQAAAVCAAAEEDEETNALDQLCEERIRDCARLAVLATRLCNDPNRP